MVLYKAQILLISQIITDMTRYFTIPGYAGSGSNHWQTWLENSVPNTKRIDQKDWYNPNIKEWADNIEKNIVNYNPQFVVLVAHSLGCLALAEWAKLYNRNIRAALLVAPPDTEIIRQKIDNDLFKNCVFQKLPFPTKLIASTNDQWASIEKAKYYAHEWGSEFINIGEAGHINDLSGHCEWYQGLEILRSL